MAQDIPNVKLFERLIPKLDAPETGSKETEDPKELINSINIKGNDFVDTDEIKYELTIRKGDKYNKLKLNRNIRRIKQLGMFKTVDHKVKNTKDGKIIDIFLEEFPLVTDIIFQGNDFFTDDYLREIIKSKPDSPYNLTSIKKDIFNIEKIYKDAGLFNAKIYNVVGPKEQSSPMTFFIAEGLIEDIIITGNIKTQDYVILREMDIRPGDPIRDITLQKNIRKIFNLQYFEEVNPEIYPGDKSHQYILKLNLKERETSGSFALGGGYSPNVGFNLFSDLYWDNVLGTGRMVMLKGNFGIANSDGENKNSTYQFRYTDPWAFGERRSLSLRAWLTQGSISSYSPLTSNFSYRNEYRTGFDALTSIPHSYDFRSSHRIKFESVELMDINYLYQIYSYELGLLYDRRNLAINTTAGSFYQFSVEKSFTIDSTSINFTQYDITYKKFFPTFEKQTIATRLKLGFLDAVGFDNADVMTAQQYYVGGSRTVRGYPDNDPFARGNKQVIASVEYRFIINTSLFFYFFADAGYASYFKNDEGTWEAKDYRNFSHYKVGKGIGVNVTIPGLGPLKLDYGIDENNSGKVQFNIGYSF